MLYLTNTRTGQKELFEPLDKSNVKMYVCGPTVYDFAHIGNARSAVAFDILYRVLLVLFKNVTYVRNITDIDDKIINECIAKKKSPSDLTKQMINYFEKDMDYLNVLRPTIEPKATDHLSDMIGMIEKLIQKNHAYISEGHVLFDVSSFKEYGKLSSKEVLEDLVAGSRIEIASYKKNPNDFVLWKPEPLDDFAYDSPFGRGRPGWHIECSSMSMKYLGETFDIHGGGIDLLFPHHENEHAQSCCYSSKSLMANFWVHNGHLSVNGQKMSKSLGNFRTVKELSGMHSSAVLRLALISSHYRKPLNWTDDLLFQSQKAIERWSQIIEKTTNAKDCPDQVLEALFDDMNTPKAISYIHELANKYFQTKENNLKEQISASLNMLGIRLEKNEASKEIMDLIEQRNIARKNKDFKQSDLIREKLLSLGFVIEDTKEGTICRKIN